MQLRKRYSVVIERIDLSGTKERMQRITMETSIANCPFNEGCRDTLHITVRQPARRSSNASVVERKATPHRPMTVGFQLRVQTFKNVLAHRNITNSSTAMTEEP